MPASNPAKTSARKAPVRKTPARNAAAARAAASRKPVATASAAAPAMSAARAASVAVVTPPAGGVPKKADGKKHPKESRDKKPKLVRDSFTIPKPEYAVLEALKLRAARAGAPAKKSEVLRAGIKALAALPDADFVAALAAVPSLKTGRPARA